MQHYKLYLKLPAKLTEFIRVLQTINANDCLEGKVSLHSIGSGNLLRRRIIQWPVASGKLGAKY